MREEINRVSADLNTWRDREERFEKLFPGTLVNNRPFLKEKLEYLENLQAKYGKSANADEVLTLRILKQQRKALAITVYPSALLRLLRNILLPFRQRQAERLSSQQVNENIQSLKEIVVKAGFNRLAQQLENQVKQGQKDFSLPVSYYINEKERVEYNLSFVKNSSGTYQFEGYKAALHAENLESGTRQQYFQVERGEIFTADQAQNLLAGRALQTGPSWVQFDLNDREADGNFRMKHFPENYGYDIKQVFERSAIKGLLNDDAVNAATRSLVAGKRHEVIIQLGDKEQKLFIEANPQHKTLIFFDTNNKTYDLTKAVAAKSQDKKQQHDLSPQRNRHIQAVKAKDSTQNKTKRQTKRIRLH